MNRKKFMALEMLYFVGEPAGKILIVNAMEHDGTADKRRLIPEGDIDMKKNVSRLIMFCAVILGFMFVVDDVGFARNHNPNFVAAHYTPGEGKPVNDAVVVKEQTGSTWESAVAWVISSAVILGSLLFIVWVVFVSKKPMLPSIPQVREAGRKHANLYKNEDGMTSSLPGAS